jgi:hypothetical protein
MSDLSFGKIIIDKTIQEAFLVRKKNDTGDIFIIDTTDSQVSIPTNTTIGTTVNPNSSTGGALNVGGDLVLGATTPRIYFPINGVGPPTLTNRSVGTKIVLWSEISSTNGDFSIGIDSGVLWNSVPHSSDSFKWYGGITEAMSLSGSGNLTIEGTTNTTTITGGSFVTPGGVGIGENLYMGGVFGILNASGHIRITTSGGDNYIQSGLTTSNSYAPLHFSNVNGGVIYASIYDTNVHIRHTTKVGTTVNPTSSTGGALNVSGDIVLGATTPRIHFPNNGVDAPTSTNRSAGTKIVLWNAISSTGVDYAIGISNSTLWNSVPGTIHYFKWYGGITEVMSLSGSGNLTTQGQVVIDTTSTEALLVRKDADGGDIFTVDTTNSQVRIPTTTKVGTTVNPTSSTGGALNVGGDIVLGATTPRIYFPNHGVAVPTLTNRSAGTKIVLYPDITSSNADFAIGISSGSLWNSIPAASQNFKWYGGITPVMSLSGTGTLTCVDDIFSFGSVSDVRLKENISLISTGMETILSLRPVTFDWKNEIFNKKYSGVSDSGFIAQEVESVLPHAVSEYTELESGGIYKNLRHERIIPYLVSAIQELHSEIEKLKAVVLLGKRE